VKIIKTSSSQEAVLYWLMAELNSGRFSDDLHKALNKLKCNEKIITNPDLDNNNDNLKRWQILKSYRSWLDINFDDYLWRLVELDQNDVSSLNYIDYSYWNELSDNTRMVGLAVKNIKNGKVVFDVPNDRFYSVAKDIKSGVDFLPIIVVSSDKNNQGEILEGHLRATGYVLSEKTHKPLKAIWGELRQ
jgi:hypothetical protein